MHTGRKITEHTSGVGANNALWTLINYFSLEPLLLPEGVAERWRSSAETVLNTEELGETDSPETELSVSEET